MSKPSPPNEPLTVPDPVVANPPEGPEALSPERVVTIVSGKAVVHVGMTDEEAYDFLGRMLGTGLGYIPGVGPIAESVFSYLWDMFDPKKQGGIQDLLVKFHDQIIREMEKMIDLNNVRQLIKEGRTKLEGLQLVGNQFNNAYHVWKDNDNESTRDQLRSEFTYLKNALIEVTPMYWSMENARYLAPMGCTISSMLFCLLRDAYYGGREWGFDPGNLEKFRDTISDQQSLVLKVLWDWNHYIAPDCSNICLYYRYVDPETPWANKRKINLHNANDKAPYNADEAHVFTAPGLFSSTDLLGYPAGNLAVLAKIRYQVKPDKHPSATITFDRDGKFDLMMPDADSRGEHMDLYTVEFNDIAYEWTHMVVDAQFKIVRNIPTVDKKITIAVKGLVYEDSLFLTEFVLVPSTSTGMADGL